MSYAVVFTPEAEDQLARLYLYIATHSSPATAQRYTEAIVAHCEGLSAFPQRAVQRDDIRPGLRITNCKGRTVIAFDVDEDRQQVSILGVFHGGQDYQVRFSPPPDDASDV